MAENNERNRITDDEELFKPFEARLSRQINLAHASRGDSLQQLITTKWHSHGYVPRLAILI